MSSAFRFCAALSTLTLLAAAIVVPDGEEAAAIVMALVALIALSQTTLPLGGSAGRVTVIRALSQTTASSPLVIA